MLIILADGTEVCARCRTTYKAISKVSVRCAECGTHPDRPVLSQNSSRRRSKVGGKRGHNSGKVSSKGKKGA